MLHTRILYSKIAKLYNQFKCACAPKPICNNPCDGGFTEDNTSSFVRVHDGMMKMAMNDAYNQGIFLGI